MKYYIDGFTLGGNPGHGGGYTIVNEYGDLIEEKTYHKPNYTNNEGEVYGLKRALQIAKSGDIISTDSQNNLYWLCSGSSEKRKDLDEVLFDSKSLLFDSGIKITLERLDLISQGKVVVRVKKGWKVTEKPKYNYTQMDLLGLPIIEEQPVVIKKKRGRYNTKPRRTKEQRKQDKLDRELGNTQ